MYKGLSNRLRKVWRTVSYWVVKSDRWLKFAIQAFFYLVVPATLAGSGPLDTSPLIETLTKSLPASTKWLAPYAMLTALWLWVATWQFIYGLMSPTVARKRLNLEDYATIGT